MEIILAVRLCRLSKHLSEAPSFIHDLMFYFSSWRKLQNISLLKQRMLLNSDSANVRCSSINVSCASWRTTWSSVVFPHLSQRNTCQPGVLTLFGKDRFFGGSFKMPSARPFVLARLSFSRFRDVPPPRAITKNSREARASTHSLRFFRASCES